MPRDGSGTYSLPATMAVASQQASSVTVNSIMNDIAQALTDAINKDGSKAFAANQSMGGYKLTSLANGTALTDAVNVSQLQKNTVQQATTVGGTVDVITLAFTPSITSYTSGMKLRWVSGGANTVTTPTVNVDGLGAKTVKKNPGGAALAVGDLGVSGTINEAVYNGTDFILVSANQTTAASDTASGIVELATTTETLTGTDAVRAVTPDSLAALWEQGADVASAATVSLGEGGYFNITGTTTITDIDFATDKAGRSAKVKFAGALTLTHNATTLILPGGANITTAAGDIAEFVSEGADVVRCTNYQKADGTAVVAASSGLQYIGMGSSSPAASTTYLSFTSIPQYTAIIGIWFAAVNSSGNMSLNVMLSSSNGSSYGAERKCGDAAGGDGFGSGSFYISNTKAAGTNKTITPSSACGGVSTTVSTDSSYSTTATETVVTGVIDAIRFNNTSSAAVDSSYTVILFGIP